VNGPLMSRGLETIDGYLARAECRALLEAIHEYQATHELPLIHRQQKGRSLRYFVIDGEAIHRSFPQIVEVYKRAAEVARSSSGLNLAPLRNRAASVNVNITPPGGEYRWHYDRNAVTAILYLNTVSGGETELYANYRVHLGAWKTAGVQRWLDRVVQFKPFLWLFGSKTVIAPGEGLLVMMRGDRCLHSVRRVEGVEDRINIVMTFDLPDAEFPVQADLDPYLYSETRAPSFDPNYRS
jgi:hypothetical protein